VTTPYDEMIGWETTWYEIMMKIYRNLCTYCTYRGRSSPGPLGLREEIPFTVVFDWVLSSFSCHLSAASCAAGLWLLPLVFL
jgi:hypothetical protein